MAGAGRDWRPAVVLTAGKSVKLGVLSQDEDGEGVNVAKGVEASLPADDVAWAARYKRKDGKTGLAKGDVILVSHTPIPDVTSQTYNQYTAVKTSAKSAWRLRQIPEAQGAVVAMDPHTGRVMAMAGGYSFKRSQYNRAVQAMRQPGSSFKPFVYMAALESGRWTPASRVLDAPYVSCDPTQSKCYKPSNYTDQFYGPSTLRFGIENSKNMMTVRLANDMGLDRMKEIGERLKIYDNLPPYESMSLGAGETTPMRLVTAYASIVNGGKRVTPILLDRIQNRYGETVYKSDKRDCTPCNTEWKSGLAAPEFPDQRDQVLDPVVAYQMVSMLEGVVLRGTAKTVLSVGKPLGAKTGTTNDYVDAWTVGFSPDLVVGVWYGFDQPKDMGEGESGGRLGAPTFRDVMMAALKDAPGLPFRMPAGVRLVDIDLDTGCLPGPEARVVITEAFTPGTEPTERCTKGEGGEGFAVDYSQVTAGDESVAAQKGVQPVASNAPIDGTAPPQQPGQPAQAPPVDLTFKEGTF
jgi:penicillin-binding protein 1A